MLNSFSIQNIFLYLFLVIGVIAYEVNLYDFYFYVCALSFFCLIVFSMLVGKKYFDISIFWWLLLLFYFISYFISIFYNADSTGLFRIIVSLLVVFVCFYISDYTANILKKLCVILIPVLLVSFLIQFTTVLSNFWDFIYSRNSSIFFDPNFASAFLGLGALICLCLHKDLRYRFFLFLLFSVGLFLTFSKTAIVALAFSVLIHFFRRLSLIYSTPLILISIISLYFISSTLDLTLFRMDQGFNERDRLWSFVFDYVINNQNLFGVGSSEATQILSFNGFKNSSTHNYYFDTLLMYGLLPFIFNLFFCFFVIFLMFIRNSVYLPIFVFLFIQSNGILISFGGISLLSVILTLLAITQISVLSARKELV